MKKLICFALSIVLVLCMSFVPTSVYAITASDIDETGGRTAFENANLTFSAFDVGDSSQDEVAIVKQWMESFGYTDMGSYNNAEDSITAKMIKEIGRNSDVIYINGHGEKYANMRIQNAAGTVVEYLCADLSCTAQHTYSVPRVVIGAKWLSGSTTTTNSYWNNGTKWGILAQCAQLNFGTTGAGAHWNGLTSAEMWARTMLGSGEQMHGYLGYYNTAPGGSTHSDRLENFFSYLDAWYSLIEAWSAAHTKLIGSSDWAAIYRDEHADDFITDMTGVYNGSDHDIYYIGRKINDTGIDLRANTLPVEEMALQISNSSIPVFVDNSTISQSAKETYSRLQNSLLNDRPGIVNIEDNGMIAYCAEDRNWGKQSRSYALSDLEAISVAERLLEEHGLLPNENYRASVSKIQRVKMDLSGEKKNEVPETIEYVVSFYRTHNGIDVLSEQEDGILVSFDAKGLTELRYLWREIDYITGMEKATTDILSISQATEIFKKEIDAGTSVVVDSTDPNKYDAYVSVAYLQTEGLVRPVYAFSSDANYANCIFVDMHTGDVLNLT